MEIKLKLREVTAYCSPCKATLADDEDLSIKVMDRGQLSKKVVLCFNGKTYLAKDKTISIPRTAIGAVNVLELTERDDSDNILRCFKTENLYVVAHSASENRLWAERQFYQEYLQKIYTQTKLLSDKVSTLEKRIADLENGKFTMLKFGGEKHEN